MVFATGNPGKLKEVRAIFASMGHQVEQLQDKYPEIQADTLEEVVEAGLQWLWQRHRAPIIIDDSGLFVDALEGFPGVYSAYALGTIGCQGILKLMDGMDNRRAVFRCCAGYVDAHGRTVIRAGQSQGRIIHEMRGLGGFGYDPIFVPEGMEETFAEIDTGMKNSMSHRSRAFELLAEAMKE